MGRLGSPARSAASAPAPALGIRRAQNTESFCCAQLKRFPRCLENHSHELRRARGLRFERGHAKVRGATLPIALRLKLRLSREAPSKSSAPPEQTLDIAELELHISGPAVVALAGVGSCLHLAQ